MTEIIHTYASFHHPIELNLKEVIDVTIRHLQVKRKHKFKCFLKGAGDLEEECLTSKGLWAYVGILYSVVQYTFKCESSRLHFYIVLSCLSSICI